MSEDNILLENFQYLPDMSVVRSSREFIKTLCKVYGSTEGLRVWDHIRAGLGDQIASDIFIGNLIIEDSLIVHSIGSHKIEAIKEVRSFSGWGLKEAKDFVENVLARGPQSLDVKNVSQDQITDFIKVMSLIGCIVK